MKIIDPGIGLGVIKFGMHPSEILELIGAPNEIEVYCYSKNKDDRSESWHYEKYGFSISFSGEDNWMLDVISISSEDYHLFNSIKIGQSINEIERILKGLEINNLEYEDLSNLESPDHKLLSIDELSLNLWFDYGQLSEIQWGPKFQDEETIIWPNQPIVKQSKSNIKEYDVDELFNKLNTHLTSWLNEIFQKNEENKDLIDEFPSDTTRDNLSIENKNVNYYLDVDNKVSGSIEAKALISHNTKGLIGWMSVIWDRDMKMLDDFLVLD
ncbi:hypothetical protein FUA23_02580 [Neolewinella aurantiaca]|uniref:Uncharacterized protein n=1 Tax=Neolewinella aurantiaca TaxID=2602767 RepID=A0A5C7FKD0_9BACT|nr:hypothetical protein [Neolewinella aurantiaca]TXF91133.1 hypothetical protein FUA23_02580 [Neolewinella aurantiaca]